MVLQINFFWFQIYVERWLSIRLTCQMCLGIIISWIRLIVQKWARKVKMKEDDGSEYLQLMPAIEKYYPGQVRDQGDVTASHCGRQLPPATSQSHDLPALDLERLWGCELARRGEAEEVSAHPCHLV
jgi:hypothetical protein